MNFETPLYSSDGCRARARRARCSMFGLAVLAHMGDTRHVTGSGSGLCAGLGSSGFMSSVNIGEMKWTKHVQVLHSTS